MSSGGRMDAVLRESRTLINLSSASSCWPWMFVIFSIYSILHESWRRPSGSNTDLARVADVFLQLFLHLQVLLDFFVVFLSSLDICPSELQDLCVVLSLVQGSGKLRADGTDQMPFKVLVHTLPVSKPCTRLPLHDVFEGRPGCPHS